MPFNMNYYWTLELLTMDVLDRFNHLSFNNAQGTKVPCSLRKVWKGCVDSTNQWLHQYAFEGRTGRWTDKVPFVCKVCFISHQHDNDVASPLCSHIVYPFCSLLEGVNVWKREELEAGRWTASKQEKDCPHKVSNNEKIREATCQGGSMFA